MNAIEQRIRETERRLFTRYDVSVSERFLDLKVAGSPLRIRVLEVGSGRPIVLLHPAGWYAAQWAPMIPHIPNHRLICVDLPGYGLSGGVDYRDHGFRDHTVAMLNQLSSELGIGIAPFVGSSLGGMAALLLAVDEPPLVSHLVILGAPGLLLPGGSLDLLLASVTIPGVNRLLLRLPSNPTRSRILSRAAFGSAALAKAPPELFELHHLVSRRSEYAVTLSTFLETDYRWRSARPHAVLTEAEIANLGPPVLFIWGETDIYGGPEVGQRAASRMQNADIKIYPGGHFPQHDDPERCGKLISDFLSARTPARDDPRS
jgi:pimeloyl-ACP methyl ester carboxylesterase